MGARCDHLRSNGYLFFPRRSSRRAPGGIDDFQVVLDHLKADDYCLFQGKLTETRRLGKRGRSSLEY
jgi:hypothetical protein